MLRKIYIFFILSLLTFSASATNLSQHEQDNIIYELDWLSRINAIAPVEYTGVQPIIEKTESLQNEKKQIFENLMGYHVENLLFTLQNTFKEDDTYKKLPKAINPLVLFEDKKLYSDWVFESYAEQVTLEEAREIDAFYKTERGQMIIEIGKSYSEITKLDLIEKAKKYAVYQGYSKKMIDKMHKIVKRLQESGALLFKIYNFYEEKVNEFFQKNNYTEKHASLCQYYTETSEDLVAILLCREGFYRAHHKASFNYAKILSQGRTPYFQSDISSSIQILNGLRGEDKNGEVHYYLGMLNRYLINLEKSFYDTQKESYCYLHQAHKLGYERAKSVLKEYEVEGEVYNCN
ncbi:MAG: hypothetical protein AAGB12_15110 [Pseudomonadota bacterium]